MSTLTTGNGSVQLASTGLTDTTGGNTKSELVLINGTANTKYNFRINASNQAVLEYHNGTSWVNKWSVDSTGAFSITNTSGNPVQIQAAGTDTDISINLVPKGAGIVQIGGTRVLTSNSISSLGALSLTTNLFTQAVSNAGYVLTNTTTQAATTNTLLYSDDPSNAAWIKDAQITVTTGVATDPDGNTLGARISQTGTFREIRQAFSASGTSTQTAIRYFAPETSTSMRFVIFWLGSSTQSAEVTINPQTGAISGIGGTVSGISATATHVGYGWYRVTLTGTGTNAANSSVQVSVYDNGSNTSYLTYCGQCTATSVATSDIHTTSTQVTRAAGVVAPQRIILPANPQSGDRVVVAIDNGITTNVVDPNGKNIYDMVGPLQLDNKRGTYLFDYVNGKWRIN